MVSVAGEPSVSIVLATYNRRDWLRLAMDSVLDQTYPNTELLVMDDGSTDGTADLLEEYARRHPPEHFRFSRHENMGQARTLNRGYEMARGEILGYLSDDDVLARDAVSRLVPELLGTPEAVAVYPGYHMIDENGEIVDTVRPIEYSPIEAYRLHDTIIGPGGLVHRRILESTGGWDPDYRWMGDLLKWIRVGTKGPVVRVPEPLASWRRHGGGLTRQTSLDRAHEHMRLLEACDAALDLPADATAIRAEALRNACILAAFFGGAPDGLDPSRFISIDLQRPEISAFGAGLGPQVPFDDRATRAAALWRELATLVVRAGELRAERGGTLRHEPGGLESARGRLAAVGLLPSEREVDSGAVRHADLYLALRYASIDCAADTNVEDTRCLLIDREATPLSDDELGVLTRNSLHASPPELEQLIGRYRRELGAADGR